MRSLLAGWRLSLHRTRADWPIVAAAWLITLLATVLFAAGPIYSSAAAVAGLRRTLADVPAADATIQVALYGTPEYLTGVDGEVQSDLQGALSPLPTQIVRDGRASATLALPTRPSGQSGDQAILGFIDDLAGHAHLVQGTWPAAGAPQGTLEVVVLDAVARDLHLSVGDDITLGAQPSAVLPVRLVGTFSIDNGTDPYWNGDQQLLTGGVAQNGADRVLGPFLTTPDGILGNPVLPQVHMQWRAFPDFNALTVDDVGAIHGRLVALQGLLGATTTGIQGSLAVTTGLTGILGKVEPSLLVTRTEVLLLMAQLAIMAAYAIVLTASLLVDHRRVETALLRSRGAGPGHVAWLALVEGLWLVIPAVLVAPWLAVAATTVLNVAGPLADIGLTMEPTVTSDSYLLAGAAGLVCLVLLVLPAFLAARNFASEQRELSRQETRTFGQRLGLDVVLLAISAIALWQLRLYGAPLTRTVQGSLGFDPLLVAAPAVGLLAGGILALRLMPLLATVLEAAISRGRAAVATLGSRQLARRPLRYTRTALLLMLALSLGVFALSYAATWSISQQDQAAYQTGAGIRATTQAGGPPLAPAAYEDLPGVQAAMAVERTTNLVSLPTGSVDVLAVDAATAPSIVRFRADESTLPFAQLMGALRAGRPQLATLPKDAAYLQVAPLLDITRIDQLPTRIVLGQDIQVTPIDPASLTGVTVNVTASVRDSHGLLYELSSGPVAVSASSEPGAGIVLPLGTPATPAGTPAPAATPTPDSQASQQAITPLDGPLELTGLELDIASLPAGSVTSAARVGVSSLSVGSAANGPWTAMRVAGWAARIADGRDVLQPVAASSVDGLVVRIGGQSGPTAAIPGTGPNATAARLSFVSQAMASWDAAIPVLANPAFLSASHAKEGDTVAVTMDGAQRRLSLVGVVDSFPTTDPTQPLLVFDESTLSLVRLQSGATRNVDEWWLSVAPGTSAQIAAALRADPFDSPLVVSAVDRTRSLSTDPVALGIIGALLLGFVATAVFALVALLASAAVSARERRTEFALLRALGLSRGQLSGWLWLENGSLVLVSLVAGTAVGVVISWIALPFITVTQQATAPVPPVLVTLPWDRIFGLDLLVGAALVVAVGVLTAVLRRVGVGSILRLGED